MKKTKPVNPDLIIILIFVLILIALFWIMPNEKVERIGDFFSKLIIPLNQPLGYLTGAMMTYRVFCWHRNKGKDPS